MLSLAAAAAGPRSAVMSDQHFSPSIMKGRPCDLCIAKFCYGRLCIASHLLSRVTLMRIASVRDLLDLSDVRNSRRPARPSRQCPNHAHKQNTPNMRKPTQTAPEFHGFGGPHFICPCTKTTCMQLHAMPLGPAVWAESPWGVHTLHTTSDPSTPCPRSPQWALCGNR